MLSVLCGTVGEDRLRAGGCSSTSAEDATAAQKCSSIITLFSKVLFMKAR